MRREKRLLKRKISRIVNDAAVRVPLAIVARRASRGADGVVCRSIFRVIGADGEKNA
ncbi:hypothetical protein [Burkholderia sp.]|uniref:hypothetical protein n=1 Tax=Burkholderia sp. TaxID=36773 RepID=UPI0025BB103D|nr:hypothetical protein [Burkholderia sp.]MBS6359488.1 hypothetical protein [Burkholderia sp.]